MIEMNNLSTTTNEFPDKNQIADVYDREVLEIIDKLNNGQKNCFNISDFYHNDFRIILTERKLRMRKVGLRGYDIIRNKFFVEEKLKTNFREKNKTTWFDNFVSYYEYVEGKIYTKACYYQCDIPNCDGIKINLEKWNKCLTYSGQTINDMKYLVEHSNRKYTHEPLIPEDIEIDYSVEKHYISQGDNSHFNIWQYWKRSDGREVEHRYYTFDYFFQAVSFLNGDFSGAHFLFCDGLKNIKDTSGLNFQDAILTSSVADGLGVDFSPYTVPVKNIKSFSVSSDNDKETEIVLASNDHTYSFKDTDATHRIVRYITDIHLMHLLQNANVRSENDLEYVIDKLARNIVGGMDPVLIGGDVCSDYEIFKLFVEALGRYRGDQYVIFVLGNHELWSFPKRSLKKIVETYRELLSQNGMYLLHNEILFIDNNGLFMGKMNRISYEELNTIDGKNLDSILADSLYTFFGGTGFSGCDDKFNATKGIYRNVITRREEILQSEIFEGLYNKIVESLPDRKIIVLTHTPMECWSKSVEYNENYIYVSGHTHKNYFYDDGKTRVYADNQIGYKGLNPHTKAFLLDISIDIFKDRKDGIYRISREEYYDFLVGKRRASSISKVPYSLYMLKKSGYYCFIRENISGGLSIMHGGVSKALKRSNIEHYYNEMDTVINRIEKPFMEYSNIQKKISNEIKRIGGTGRVHGCIIDIDFYDHIYLNPNDLTITGYYATDKENKYVYPSIPALLKAQCPQLFCNLSKLKDSANTDLPSLYNYSMEDLDASPIIENNTDIYKMSEALNRMQRLDSNILTLWTEENFEKELLALESNNI